MSRIRFTQDTIIKQKPAPANTLPNYETQAISKGTVLVVNSIDQPANANQHYRFSLKYITFQQFSDNWYVYVPHSQILNESVVSVPSITQLIASQANKNVVQIKVNSQSSLAKLVFNIDTYIKRAPVLADILVDNALQLIPAGTELVLANKPDVNNTIQLPIEGLKGAFNHVRVSLKGIDIKGYDDDWYVFADHVGLQQILL